MYFVCTRTSPFYFCYCPSCWLVEYEFVPTRRPGCCIEHSSVGTDYCQVWLRLECCGEQQPHSFTSVQETAVCGHCRTVATGVAVGASQNSAQTRASTAVYPSFFHSMSLASRACQSAHLTSSHAHGPRPSLVCALRLRSALSTLVRSFWSDCSALYPSATEWWWGFDLAPACRI